MEKNVRIDSKAFYKTVAALVIPMALQNLINVAVQSADVLMLGWLNEIVLSASSLAGQVQFVLTLLFFGISSGASVLTAQFWGKGDTRTIEKVLAIAVRLAVAAAMVFALAALLIPTRLMRIFSPDEMVIAEGVKYLRLVAPSYIFMAFTNIYLNIMRSVEKVVVSTLVYFVSFWVNVGLNAVLIFGLLGAPALGIRGAAIATCTARFVELVITVVYAVRNKDVRMKLKDYLSWPGDLFRRFLKYAAPTTINEVLWGLAISMNSVIIGHLGASAVAANSVAQVCRQLATVICFGISGAAAVMIGKAIGAGEPERARAYGGKFVRMTLLTGLGGSLVILLIRPFVVRAMNLGPQAEEYLLFLLLVMSVYVIAQSFNTTMIVGIFRGGGDTRFGLFLDAGTMWLGSLLWGALAAFVFKLPVPVVYVIIMSDEFIKMPITILRYRSKRWLRDVTR